MLLTLSKKTVESLISLFVIVTITFFLLRLLPGGPFDSETALAPEVKANLEKQYHLNESVFAQYESYLQNIAHGNFGKSYRYIDQDITEILKQSLPATLTLGFLALILSVFLGIPLGLLAVAKFGKKVDLFINSAAIALISIPSFILAPLLILVFSFWLDLLPPALWDGPRFYVLPVLSLGLRPAAIIVRLIRASGIEVRGTDYILAARAKGISQSKLFLKHVLKNSLVPLLAISGTLVAHILSGGLVIELIFAVPGVARHFVESVSNRDYTLILALTLFYSVVLIVSNWIFDAMMAWVDPRVRSI